MMNTLFNKGLGENQKCVLYFYLKTKGIFWPTQYIPFDQMTWYVCSNLTVSMEWVKVWFSYPMDYTVHGILQARVLEWVAFPFSRGSSRPTGQTCVSCIQADSLPSELPKNLREATAKSPHTATRVAAACPNYRKACATMQTQQNQK